MFEEYAQVVSELGLEEVMQQGNEEDIPKELNLLRNCVDMYDQEYMVKVIDYEFYYLIFWSTYFYDRSV